MKKMKKTLTWLLAACMAGLGSVGPAAAHHNASAQYDVNKAIKLEAVLTKVEWTNPHAHMTFDVKGSDGKTRSWLIEFFGIAGMRRMRLTRDDVKLGDSYTLTVSPARDGRTAGLIQTMTFSDGRVLSTSAVPPELR